MEPASSSSSTSAYIEAKGEPFLYVPSQHIQTESTNPRPGRKTNFQLVAIPTIEGKKRKKPVHQKEKTIVCNFEEKGEMCDKRFTTKGQRNTHIQIFHNKIRKYRCQNCFEKYSKLMNVDDLKSLLDENGKLTYTQVELNGKVKTHTVTVLFGKLYDMKKHINALHNKLVVICKFCNHKFANKPNLSRHLKYGKSRCIRKPEGLSDDELEELMNNVQFSKMKNVNEPKKVHSLEGVQIISPSTRL